MQSASVPVTSIYAHVLDMQSDAVRTDLTSSSELKPPYLDLAQLGKTLYANCSLTKTGLCTFGRTHPLVDAHGAAGADLAAGARAGRARVAVG